MEWISQPVKAIDKDAREQVHARLSERVIPSNALGKLEDLVVTMAGLQGITPHLDKVRVSVFAANHGVLAEHVSASSAQVTEQRVSDLVSGQAPVCVLARQYGAELELIDLGVSKRPEMSGYIACPVAASSANLMREAAMTDEQLVKAMEVGRQQVERACADGVDLLIAGEVGVGNTTAAAALSCALTGLSPLQLSGLGAGADHDTLKHKREVIEQALNLHSNCQTPLEWLRAVGGFDIAAMTGFYLRAAQLGIPVILDGFVSAAAALVAIRLSPGIRYWLVFSHCSAEQGHKMLLEQLEGHPLVQMELRLGEGVGALVVLPLLQSACQLYRELTGNAQGMWQQEA